jgi:hypothetical protein
VSDDYAVWYSSKRLTDVEATEIFRGLAGLGAPESAAGIANSPRLDEFVAELNRRYPADDESSIWSSEPAYDGRYVYMTLRRFSLRSLWATFAIIRLAKRYGLTAFDPQSSTLL